jgi:heparan-alpha-glucosaminide N-acetyltransferase
MSTITSAVPHPLATQTVHHRIVSLDILRGLNVALMIFINELAKVKGSPWWTYHAPGKIDAMTYVDMVFPGSLFILGMAIPLARQARIKKGHRIPAILGHIALRSVALIVLAISASKVRVTNTRRKVSMRGSPAIGSNYPSGTSAKKNSLAGRLAFA